MINSDLHLRRVKDRYFTVVTKGKGNQMRSIDKWAAKVLLLFLCTFCAPVWAQDAGGEVKKEPVADTSEADKAGKALLLELQDKFIEAVGGREVLEKFSNRKMSSKVKIADAGLEADLNVFVDSQGHFLESMVITGYGDFQQGLHGDVAWSLDPINGPRLLTGKEKDQLIRSGRLQPALWLARDHQSAEKAGEETVNDVPCTIYDLKTKTGSIHKYWISNEDGLARKVAMTLESPMGKIPVQIWMTDYKALDGIMYPYQMKMKQGVQNMEVQVMTVEHDGEVDPAVLKLPEPVQKLVDRNKPKEEETVEEPKKESGR